MTVAGKDADAPFSVKASPDPGQPHSSDAQGMRITAMAV